MTAEGCLVKVDPGRSERSDPGRACGVKKKGQASDFIFIYRILRAAPERGEIW